MVEWETNNKRFLIRDVEGEPEFHAIEDLQKEAWQFSDLDVVPAATLIATQHAGGIVLGAFDGDLMIGFAYAFPAFEQGRASMHSHMLAVKPEYRNCHAGFYLKLAQRERALEKGLDEITWTFDPLQSLNAHLNFAKLGVISNRYIPNFYGEATSSPLHIGFGTDRLWVRWLLNSQRVRQCIAEGPSRRPPVAAVESGELIRSALIYGEDMHPMIGDFKRLSDDRCTIEIPSGIKELKDKEPQLGIEWREATRAAFLSALEAGFTVQHFIRIEAVAGPRWFYLLEKITTSDT
jgi:predicted GNAT superfamily acetyltransferase